jgi:alpha-tubulin suppressor-like RCC1 family protein
MGKIVQISAGCIHSLFLNDEGQVFGCGNNEHGQITIPVDVGRKIQISAGGSHSLFLSEFEQVFGCGHNDDGQLNIPSDLILVSNDWVLK